MATIKATMNLMALLKAGAMIQTDNVRIAIDKNRIITSRFLDDGLWHTGADFPLTQIGLENCVEYVNLPF